jgi:cysteinyl-tRNA synthetase
MSETVCEKTTLSNLDHLIKLTDTLTNKPYVVKNGERLKIYICGPTVYTDTHIGHLKTYMTFDILRRTLENYLNIPVQHMMNITDVDDKIINSTYAKEYADEICEYSTKHLSTTKPTEPATDEPTQDMVMSWLKQIGEEKYLKNESFRNYAEKYENLFFDTLDRVGINRPHVLTRVTDHIKEIFDFVEKIESNGYTFVDDGSVYFWGT